MASLNIIEPDNNLDALLYSQLNDSIIYNKLVNEVKQKNYIKFIDSINNDNLELKLIQEKYSKHFYVASPDSILSDILEINSESLKDSIDVDKNDTMKALIDTLMDINIDSSILKLENIDSIKIQGSSKIRDTINYSNEKDTLIINSKVFNEKE